MGSRGISYLKVSENLPINVVEEPLLVCWAGRAGSELGAGLWSGSGHWECVFCKKGLSSTNYLQAFSFLVFLRSVLCIGQMLPVHSLSPTDGQICGE